MIKTIKFSKKDYDFFFPLLDEEYQDVIKRITIEKEDEIIIDDEDIEVDLYDWLNDLVIEIGLDKNYNLNNIGLRLEKLSNYVSQ